jgi:hypothetical protein
MLALACLQGRKFRPRSTICKVALFPSASLGINNRALPAYQERDHSSHSGGLIGYELKKQHGHDL